MKPGDEVRPLPGCTIEVFQGGGATLDWYPLTPDARGIVRIPVTAAFIQVRFGMFVGDASCGIGYEEVPQPASQDEADLHEMITSKLRSLCARLKYSGREAFVLSHLEADCRRIWTLTLKPEEEP